MIFQTDEQTLQKDLRAFLSLTSDRQAHFDAAPDAVPSDRFGVNEQQKRLHPDRQTFCVREKTHTVNGLLFVSLTTGDKPAAVFRPGQQARVYCDGISYPVFLASGPADAAKGQYTIGVDPGTLPAVYNYLDGLAPGDALTLRAPIGSFYYLGARDRGPLTFICDKSGLPAAAAFAEALPEKAFPGLAFYCVDCAPEPFFDSRFRVADLSEALSAAADAGRVFVCGSRTFCAEVKSRPALYRARICVTEPPRRETPLKKTFSCTLRSADGTQTFPCSADLPLLASLEAAGVCVPANCSGGECGFCRCRILSGRVSLYDPAEEDPRRMADAARSVVHACRTFPDSDLTIAF